MEEVEGAKEELDSSSGKLEDDDEPPGFGPLTPGVKIGNRIAPSGWKKLVNLSVDSGHTSIKETPLGRTFARRVKELRIPLTGGYGFYRRTPSRSKMGLPLIPTNPYPSFLFRSPHVSTEGSNIHNCRIGQYMVVTFADTV